MGVHEIRIKGAEQAKSPGRVAACLGPRYCGGAHGSLRRALRIRLHGRGFHSDNVEVSVVTKLSSKFRLSARFPRPKAPSYLAPFV